MNNQWFCCNPWCYQDWRAAWKRGARDTCDVNIPILNFCNSYITVTII